MIKDVYELLLVNKETIQNKMRLLSELQDNSLNNKIREKWVEYCPSENSTSTLLAIDGGMWIKELRHGFVYVVNAEVVKAEGFNIVPLDSLALVDVIRPGNLARERISLIMQLLELKLAYKHAEEADYILFDGSIVKKIGNIKFKSKITLLDDLDITSQKIFSLDEKDEESMYLYLIAENHLLISSLIEKYKDKLVWVSKNSKSTELFNESVSDVSLLELFTKSCGYSTFSQKTIKEENILSDKASKILGNQVFYSTYVRLKEEEKVLKIDIFNTDIKKIFNVLYSVNVKGYPFPLLKVHTDVKVSKDDRERIQQLLNIKKRNIEWWPNQLF